MSIRFGIVPKRRASLPDEEARKGTIRHHIPAGVLNGTDDASPEYACVWCGQPTKIMAETPFRPDLGFIPLMLTCGAELRAAWRQHQAGLPLDPEAFEGMLRLASLRRVGP